MNDIWRENIAALPALSADCDMQAARRLAGYLGETDAEPIYRLIQLFGVDLVAAKAHDAIALWQTGQAPRTYALSRLNGQETPLVAANGQRRSRGDVFFYLMRQQCTLVGVRWIGVWDTAHGRKRYRIIQARALFGMGRNPEKTTLACDIVMAQTPPLPPEGLASGFRSATCTPGAHTVHPTDPLH